jgi:hypothetical protein
MLYSNINNKGDLKMSKYGPATEKQIDLLITFMESHLIHRNFTPAESANMRQVLYTIIHTAQMEVVGAVGNESKKNLNENNAEEARKLRETLKSMEWLWKPPTF